MLSAWKFSGDFGPLQDWKPGRPLRLAAWVASGAGNERLSSALDWINWRHDRTDPERAFRAIFARMRWKPVVTLLPEVDGWLDSKDSSMPDDVRSDFHAMKAWALALMRDFERSRMAMEAALAMTPERSWTHVQQSGILVMRDRYEEALESARCAVELNAAYRPAVLQAVECLIHLNRDEEAIDLLQRSHELAEHGSFMLRLQGIHSEREEHKEALHCLDEAERLMPMMPNTTREWLAGRRADFLYMAGDLDGSLAAGELAGKSGARGKVTANLRRPDVLARKRRRLAVSFTRQHNMTCAPATLASLAKFWQRDHDHLEIAAAICDEGTPWHKERGWAESNGFIAREFRFNREILIALIDRGIPFTLTTSWVTGAHLQACIGYDDRQGTVLLRDPTHRHFGEILMDDLIDSHPIHGPRCMLLLPEDQAGLLDGISLPDEALHEAAHQLALAIEKHDRWAAQSAVSTLRALNDNHPLTHNAESQFASYLGHYEKEYAALSRLTGMFPDHQPVLYLKVAAMKRLGEQAELRELLERMATKDDVAPVFIAELGELLMEDARQLSLAGHFLRRALRLQPNEGRMLESLARWEIKRGNFHEATRLRRFASTLSPSWEPYATACFESFRMIGKPGEGIEFLRERARLAGARRSPPWLTLAQAFDTLYQHGDARSTLEEAIRLRPDDGELRLKAGRMMIFWGEEERQRGLEWIDEAKGRVSETVWLRERAWTAGALGDRSFAIHFWKALLAREPLAIDAHRALARLIAEESGKSEAIRFLTESAEKNRRQPALWVALADWLAGEKPAACLPALNRALELDPDDVWVLRQRAGKRFAAGDRSGGLEDAREALARAPMAPESHGVLGSLLHQSGEKAEALECLRSALRLNIDYTFALEHLVAWLNEPAAIRDALAFIEEEMNRQVSNGDCVTTYQQAAWAVVPTDVLLETLRKFCVQRPDLWQTWSARIVQCLGMGRLDEARECGDRLKESFPILPRTWIEVAKVENASGDHPAQAAALRQAVALAPAWDWAVRQLGEVLERLGRYDEARAVLERAIDFDPLNGPNHGCLADLLYKMGRKDEAFAVLLAAMSASPFYRWGWNALAGWADTAERLAGLEKLIETQSQRLLHNPEWWTIVADLMLTLGRKDDALEAAQSGLAMDPDHHELRDQQITILCGLERFDEALEVCSTAATVTRELEGRRAWVLMESGDGPAAIAAMKAVLEREPDYSWGWRQLAGWHFARGEWKKLADAARQWARVTPEDSIAHGHVGLAALELGDKEGAKLAFERAFRLDPEYQFAGRELLKLQVAAREFPAAETTLNTLGHYAPGPWLDCEAVALALAKNDVDHAFALGAGIQRSADNPAPLIQVQKEFTSRGFQSRWRDQVESMISDGQANSPASLAAWAALFHGKSELAKAVKRLARLPVAEASKDAAWNVLLRSAHESGSSDLMHKWIRRHRQRFINNGELWNTVGELLLITGRQKATVEWLAGWKEREADVGAHTLVNLTAAMDHVHGPERSEEARAAGIARFRTDDNVLYLRAAHGAYLAAADRIDEARRTLAPIEDSRISSYYLGTASLGRAVVAAAGGDESEAQRQYQIGLEQFRAWPSDKTAKEYLISSQKALARHFPWAAGKRRKITKRWGAHPSDTLWQSFLRVASIVILVGFAIAAMALIVFGDVSPAVFIVPAVLMSFVLARSSR